MRMQPTRSRLAATLTVTAKGRRQRRTALPAGGRRLWPHGSSFEASRKTAPLFCSLDKAGRVTLRRLTTQATQAIYALVDRWARRPASAISVPMTAVGPSSLTYSTRCRRRPGARPHGPGLADSSRGNHDCRLEFPPGRWSNSFTSRTRLPEPLNWRAEGSCLPAKHRRWRQIPGVNVRRA
jgi:hypothetical protein